MNKLGLSIIVVGASGDLSRRKLFPALFALYCRNLLPEGFNIYGFARSKLSQAGFREKITEHLTCRYVPSESCAEKMEKFLDHCFYVAGEYGSKDSLLDLYQIMSKREGGSPVNRIFYLAVPPFVFLNVAGSIGDAGLIDCTPEEPWTRAVMEKPFGKDRQSSDDLTSAMGRVFTETQTYRIDHYLGKEVIQNLMVLRFANLIFEPLWNRKYIESVHIDWREKDGIDGRGGYFDEYGIVRDVIQNHLLQVLSLVAMERPEKEDARHVRDAKVKVLKDMPPLRPEDVVVGQYDSYRNDPSVPSNSRTATYAAVKLRINNERWSGVPFVITAGKGLDARSSEVIVRFRGVPENIFCPKPSCLPNNRLVIRIQPNEAINLHTVVKEPGLEMALTESKLDLIYSSAFSKQIPDAYECLLLDVIQGDKSLFIRSDELEASWDIFTPALHCIEDDGVKPELYKMGSAGPLSAARVTLEA